MQRGDCYNDLKKRDLFGQLWETIEEKLEDRLVEEEDKNPLPVEAREFIEENIYIRTKDKRVVQLKYNPIQEDYWYKRTKRDIILKPRQLGFSTLLLAEYFEDTINTPNTSTVIIAHDLDSTRKLFNVIQLMYDRLPEAKKRELNRGKSKPKYGNRREYYFEAINSRITVGTAGTVSFGRGDTINNLHCSEVAFWPNPEALMTGLLQSVPYNGRIVIETTANGVGNYFHKTYMDAKDSKGRWKAHFYRWFDHPEYKLPLEPGEKIELTASEEKLIEAYGLSLEQIKWQRWKISEMPERDGKSKEDWFQQEYPEDDISCFLNSGRPALNQQSIQVMLNRIKKQNIGYVSYEIDYVTGEVVPSNVAELKVWKEPEEGRRYIIGADTSEGKPGGDFSCGEVLDRETGEQVAELHGRWDPDIFGKKLAALGSWYNNAVIGPERNNHGHSVLNTLINQASYDNLYHYVDYDSDTGKEKKEPGWPTNQKTRPIMMSELRTVIRDMLFLINSEALLNEFFTFIVNDKGKEEAQQGCHDDRVMAYAIAIQVRATAETGLPLDPKTKRLLKEASLYG